MALPEVAPLDIVGITSNQFAKTVGPNNVKDGTPDHRAVRRGWKCEFTFHIRP